MFEEDRLVRLWKLLVISVTLFWIRHDIIAFLFERKNEVKEPEFLLKSNNLDITMCPLLSKLLCSLSHHHNQVLK